MHHEEVLSLFTPVDLEKGVVITDVAVEMPKGSSVENHNPKVFFHIRPSLRISIRAIHKIRVAGKDCICDTVWTL